MEHLFKEYYHAGATYLLPETLKKICNSHEKIKNAVTVMAKKHHISTKRVYEIWHKHALGQSDRAQQDLQSGGAEHDNSSSTIMQEDGIIHTEHPADDENGPNSPINSNSLNTVTNGRKDKVSRKKKVSIKPKDESSFMALVEKKVDNAPKGSDTSRRESDLNKLVNITREAVMHPIYFP